MTKNTERSSKLIEQNNPSWTYLKLLFKFITHPSIALMLATGPTKNGTLLLGQELVNILIDLSDNITVLLKKLLSNKEETNIDELYESIKIPLDNLFNKNIEHYHFNLRAINIDSILTESFIKTNLLPLFLTLRDVPQLVRSIKEKNFIQLVQDVKAQLTKHIEINIHHELRTYLIINSNGLYDVQLKEPALVSQFKKIFNTLTLAEKILAFITSLNPDFDLHSFLLHKKEKQVQFLSHIVWYLFMKDSVIGSYVAFEYDLAPEELHFISQLQEVIEQIRQIQSSLLETDLPLEQIFTSELSSLNSVITQLQAYTAQSNEIDKKYLFNQELSDTISSYIGKSIGFFINQLKPLTGKRDFNFLTHHLGLLPHYLDSLTQLIYSYGVNQPNRLSTLSQSEQDAYKSQAIKLFFALNDFEHLFFWQKAQTLIFPIRNNLTTLGQGVQNQASHLHQATQELVIYQLSRIKNELFAKIICESDKMELYLGLICGTLTQPLMLQLNELYQILVTQASLLVDLNKNHIDLLHLDNASFLAKRIQNMLLQKNECQLKYTTAQGAKKAIAVFLKEIIAHLRSASPILLEEQYQVFKAYVIVFNPRLSVLLDSAFTQKHSILNSCSIDELQKMAKATINACNKELCTYSSYITLSESWLLEIPKQSKNKLVALPHHKQHSLLAINEVSWLMEQTTCKEKLSDIIEKKPQFVTNLTSLSADERAELYTYHTMRISALHYSATIITKLIAILETTTEQTQKKHLNTLINYYKIVQPYLVDFNAADQAPTLDERCVTIFNQLSNNILPSSSPRALWNELILNTQTLTRTIGEEIEYSEHRRELFTRAHHKKRTTLSNNLTLTMDSELVQRQDKWIRQQNLSRSISKINALLLQFLGHLDPCLKMPLHFDSLNDVVPFPEMEIAVNALAQATQVSWAKRAINALYYISSAFKYLEALDRNVQNKETARYVLNGPLVECLYQLDPFLKISKASQTFMELMNEPIGQLFVTTLRGESRNALSYWAKINPQQFINTETAPLASPQPQSTVPPWLLSLLVYPQQIVNDSNTMNAQPIKDAARKMAAYIEQILERIEQRNYLHLLLHSPYLLFSLIPQLFHNLIDLAENTHQITIAHLNDIQQELYKILIKIDGLELKFGLRIGLLSRPTKHFIDTLFYNFIKPLAVNLVEKNVLIHNVNSFKSRAQTNRNMHGQAIQQLEYEKNTLHTLSYFLQRLQEIKSILESKKRLLTAEQEEFATLYRQIHPLLHQQKKHYPLSLAQQDTSKELDAFCKSCLMNTCENNSYFSHTPPLEHVLFITKQVHAAKKGNVTSLELRITYLNSQARFFSAEKEYFSQSQAKETIRHYIAYIIDKKIEHIVTQAHELIYMGEEYKNILQCLLQHTKESILNQVDIIAIDRMEQMISDESQKTIHLVHEQYHQLCHLDAIIIAVAAFQAYCQKEKHNPTYEQLHSLSSKIALLNQIMRIALNEKIPPKTRIELIQEEARKESFYTILMAQELHFSFDFKSLKRLVLNLFHRIFNFLGLTYRPEELHSTLNETIKTAPQHISPLEARGFFAPIPTHKINAALNDETKSPIQPGVF